MPERPRVERQLQPLPLRRQLPEQLHPIQAITVVALVVETRLLVALDPTSVSPLREPLEARRRIPRMVVTAIPLFPSLALGAMGQMSFLSHKSPLNQSTDRQFKQRA